MLEHIDAGLEALLRASVPLSALDVDVSFEAPDRDWSAKLSRATVNCFLWDIRLSSDRSEAGVQTIVRDGVRMYAPVPPMLELRYVLTAWTSDHRDERSLLSGLTRSVLAAGEIPRTYLPDEVAHLETPTLTMARAGEEHMDVFKALEGKIKPGLNVVVTTPYDVGLGVEVGPPVDSIVTAVSRTDGGESAPQDRRRRVAGEIPDASERELVGAVVRSPVDAARVNDTGRFLVVAATGDQLVLDRPDGSSEVVVVPEAGGVVFP